MQHVHVCFFLLYKYYTIEEIVDLSNIDVLLVNDLSRFSREIMLPSLMPGGLLLLNHLYSGCHY